jgi:hypothetical protein
LSPNGKAAPCGGNLFTARLIVTPPFENCYCIKNLMFYGATHACGICTAEISSELNCASPRSSPKPLQAIRRGVAKMITSPCSRTFYHMMLRHRPCNGAIVSNAYHSTKFKQNYKYNQYKIYPCVDSVRHNTF